MSPVAVKNTGFSSTSFIALPATVRVLLKARQRYRTWFTGKIPTM